MYNYKSTFLYNLNYFHSNSSEQFWQRAQKQTTLTFCSQSTRNTDFTTTYYA